MPAELIRYPHNPSLTIKAVSGHFATRHSHNSHYLDITPLLRQSRQAWSAAAEAVMRISPCDRLTVRGQELTLPAPAFFACAHLCHGISSEAVL